MYTKSPKYLNISGVYHPIILYSRDIFVSILNKTFGGKKMKCKSLLLVFLVAVLTCSFASAELISGEDGVDVTVSSVEVNDVELEGISGPKNLEKTDELEILVVFSINKSIDNVQIEAELTGYDNSDRDKVTETTDTFDVTAGDVYDKRLDLQLPIRFDQGRYSLKIRFETPLGTLTKPYLVDINTQDHLIEIRDITLSPENDVKTGRALLVTARIKNRGESEEEDIKVKASVPALGISASDYLDQLDPEDCTGSDCDDSTTSEELYMRIPDCAEPGEYTVRVCVEYDDGDEEECDTTKINVVSGDVCNVPTPIETVATTGKTIITIGPETQDIAVAGSGMYPVTIANQGAESKIYSISVDSADWAEFAVNPSSVLVVGSGESKAAYVNVQSKAGVSGLQVFSVTIKSGESVLKQVPLRANVVGSGVKATASLNLGSAKKALEIGLVILVVLLVILGLIIGFNKLKGDNEDEDEGDEKTYY